MICEYQDCENPAEATIFDPRVGQGEPLCVVCIFHKEMIQSSPVQALAVEAHVHRTVWLTEPSFPGRIGAIQ